MQIKWFNQINKLSFIICDYAFICGNLFICGDNNNN